MKKVVLIALCSILSLSAFTHPLTVRKAFHRYGHNEGVTRITVPGIVIRVASWLVDDAETEALLKGIHKVKVLVAEGADNQINPDFTSKVITEIRESNFEEMLSVSDQNDQVEIFIREGRKNKKELVLFTTSKDASNIVYLKGKITPELLKQLSDNPGRTRVSKTLTI